MIAPLSTILLLTNSKPSIPSKLITLATLLIVELLNLNNGPKVLSSRPSRPKSAKGPLTLVKLELVISRLSARYQPLKPLPLSEKIGAFQLSTSSPSTKILSAKEVAELINRGPLDSLVRLVGSRFSCLRLYCPSSL